MPTVILSSHLEFQSDGITDAQIFWEVADKHLRLPVDVFQLNDGGLQFL